MVLMASGDARSAPLSNDSCIPVIGQVLRGLGRRPSSDELRASIQQPVGTCRCLSPSPASSGHSLWRCFPALHNHLGNLPPRVELADRSCLQHREYFRPKGRGYGSRLIPCAPRFPLDHLSSDALHSEMIGDQRPSVYGRWFWRLRNATTLSNA